MTTKLYRFTDDEQKLLVSVMGNYEDENPYFVRACQRILAELERGGTVEQDDEAAHALVSMMWLYPNYRVDSRGPIGKIMDALRRIAPDVYAELENEDAADVCMRRWPE